MHPRLIDIPIWVIALIGGGMLSLSFFGDAKRIALALGAALAGVVVAGGFAFSQSWGHGSVPVQSYGTMILIGFLTGVGMAAYRSRRIGVDPKHCIDVGVYGVMVGLVGARLLHIASNWGDFTPFLDGGFSGDRVLKMFKVWEAGLDFFGAFITTISFTYFYCKYFKIPAIPFLDLAVPSLIAGQAFGRIGCLLYGCCYGKPTELPWNIHFPPDSPAFNRHVTEGLIAETAKCSLGIHPTQIYASIAAFLTAGFLYAYWPRRPYDGSVLALMMIMAGATRFFEELLRADEPPLFASVPWLTAAHYFALAAIATGVFLMLYFRREPKLYKPLTVQCGL